MIQLREKVVLIPRNGDSATHDFSGRDFSNYLPVGIQEKLGRASLSRKRKLYDNNIRLVGRSLYAVRLTVTEDRYGDTTDLTIHSHNKIEAIIDYPDGVPLYTDRTTNVSTTGSFIYDILPIEGYFRFEDNIQPDDILVVHFYDQQNEGFLQVYKVAELVGNFGIGVLSMRYSLAPYNEFLEEYPSVKQLIENYELEKFPT